MSRPHIPAWAYVSGVVGLAAVGAGCWADAVGTLNGFTVNAASAGACALVGIPVLSVVVPWAIERERLRRQLGGWSVLLTLLHQESIVMRRTWKRLLGGAGTRSAAGRHEFANAMRSAGFDMVGDLDEAIRLLLHMPTFADEARTIAERARGLLAVSQPRRIERTSSLLGWEEVEEPDDEELADLSHEEANRVLSRGEPPMWDTLVDYHAAVAATLDSLGNELAALLGIEHSA